MRGIAPLVAVALLMGGTATAHAETPVLHEQFSFQFGDFTAGGELDYPTGAQDAPVVVLIPGSGPEDRNADIGTGPTPMSHIFSDIANGLTQRGFAVMRYDKRYVSGYQKVDYQSFYTKLDPHGMLSDADTVLRAAEADPHVDRHRVFLYGWSEGSTVTAALAAMHPELAGVVFQGSVNESWRDLFAYQTTGVSLPYLRQYGTKLTPADLKRAAAGSGGRVATEWLGFIMPNAASGDFTISPVFDTNGDGELDLNTEFVPGLERTFDAQFKPGGQFAIYTPDRALPPVIDQARALSRFPVLILQGGRDANVPPSGAFQLNATLRGDHTLRFYPVLGHTLGDTPSRIGDNFQPIAQQPIDDVARWLDQVSWRAGGPPRTTGRSGRRPAGCPAGPRSCGRTGR
jgi:uncharacterized protein